MRLPSSAVLVLLLTPLHAVPAHASAAPARPAVAPHAAAALPRPAIAAALRARPAAPATRQSRPDDPQQAAEAIRDALRRGENPGVALKHAEALRDDFDDEAFAPVIEAAGLAFKNDKRLHQCLVMDTYAVLLVPGSTEHFEDLLDVPDQVEGTLLRNTYALAIKTAGALHEERALKPLEKLLAHEDTRFAKAAAVALAHYTELPDKAKDKLLDRLVKALGKVERKLDHRDEELARHAAQVSAALDATLLALSLEPPEEGEEPAAPDAHQQLSADAWKARLKERKQRRR